MKSVREDDTGRQSMVKALGRKDALAATGELDQIAASNARHRMRSRILSASTTGELGSTDWRSSCSATCGSDWESQGQHFGIIGAVATYVDGNHPLPTADSANLPFAVAAAMTVGTVHTPQRAIGANCTAAGTATLMMANASTMTVAWVSAGRASPAL